MSAVYDVFCVLNPSKITWSRYAQMVRAVIDTFFSVDISEVNYVTCRYIIDNIQTHFPF